MAILIAGVGNELKGDDAFGIRCAQAFDADPRKPKECTVQQTGIGGIHLVQELMRGYDALILFDAFDRGGAPGDIWLLEPELPRAEAMTDRARRDFFADVHYATPVRALTLAQSVDALPSLVRIVGCQPFDPDSFDTDMHASVVAAIPSAVDKAFDVISDILASQTNNGTNA